MTTQQQQPAAQTALQLVTSMRPAFKDALPRHLDPDRFMRVALTALRRTPKLQECNTPSLLGAMMVCSQLGLEPNDPRQLAFLIPFNGECQLIIGYRGYIELALRSGMVKSIQAETVYARDTFEYEQGLNAKLRHVPYMGGEDPGDVVCSYAIAQMADGAVAFVVVPVRDIEKARMVSQTGKRNTGPWKEWYGEMAMKTAIRRLAKRIPQSPEFAQAVHVDGGHANLNRATLEVDVTPPAELPERAEPTRVRLDPEEAKPKAPEAVAEVVDAKPIPKEAPMLANSVQRKAIASALDAQKFDGVACDALWRAYGVAKPTELTAADADEILALAESGELKQAIGVAS